MSGEIQAAGSGRSVTPPGGVTIQEAIQRVLSKYADFSGRAPRSEYWWWTLAAGIGAFVAGLLGDAVTIIFLVATFLPSLAVTVRRLHDIDKSGWWVLISIIPLVGPIVLIVFAATEGSRQPNEWGPPVTVG